MGKHSKNYPRPQLKRDNYKILDEGWQLNGSHISVPFPPQSELAEYNSPVEDVLKYTCSFKKYGMEDMRTILHFGAVDQVAEVYLNNKPLGVHEGGYLPFSFDITDTMEEDNVLTVIATDTLDKKYPYGKQTKKPGGMWYTPVSGIWQNVWLESVPRTYISSLKITPDDKSVKIELEINKECENTDNSFIKIKLHDGYEYEAPFKDGQVYIDMTNIKTAGGKQYIPKMWSPDSPYLYEAEITVGDDRVETYFALRKIEIKEIGGVNRVSLNGKAIFMNGVLDQGYFCDGIFLPENEAEYEQDVLRMKELGVNMLRKHIKIEPESFYYYCDVHGMLVMQDMVNNGKYSFVRDTALPTVGFTKRNDTNTKTPKETKDIFEKHMKDTIEHLYNHPSIVAYTIFNEGWGQFDSDRMYKEAKELDSTRLYDATSGWFAQNDSDFDSVHLYFGKKLSDPKERPMFLSEFGGYTYGIAGHMYSEDKNYGYGKCKDKNELTERIVKRYEELVLPFIEKGLCGSVYTQLSDVEEEINGFYTYDRKVCKVDKDMMRRLCERITDKIKAINKE